MAKVIKFNEFMNGEYKVKENERKQKRNKKLMSLGMAAILPVATCGTVGLAGLIIKTATLPAAAVPAMAPVAVEVGAKEWMSQQTLSTLAHVLDPLVDIMVALSFPIASVIIVGSCFFFMFDKAERAWSMIMKAGLGYVLIQVSPLILNVLKQVGNAV
jgi:hypothetical protein